MRGVKDLIGSLRSRKVHAYCVGAAKTGTTSIAHMLTPHFRSAHEPNTVQTTQLVIDYLSGNVDFEATQAALIKRDKQLNLEFESSHPLGYFAKQLVSLFPEAKFIITVREPTAWIASRISFHAERNPPEWQAYRDYIWQRHHQCFDSKESALENAGLYSLDGYLAQYSEQYEILFENIPPSQSIIVRTEDIDSATSDIAAFLNIDAHSIEATQTNKMEKARRILDELDPQFLCQKVEQHCGWLKSRFWS